MDKFDDILKESKNISDFKSFDVDQEWNNFIKVLENENLIEADTFSKKSNHFNKILISTLLIIIIGTSLFFLLTQKPKKVFEIRETKENLDTISFADGSQLFLGKHSKAEFPVDFTQGERYVKMQGEGTFDIQHNPAKPFNVYFGELQIKVLGTKFSLLKMNNMAIIENHSGRVAVSQILNQSNTVILEANEVYLYESGKFKTPKDTVQEIVVVEQPVLKQKPKPQPIVKEVIKEEEPVKEEIKLSTYYLEDVINDHLLKYFKKNVKVEKKSKLELKAKIKLNINAPLESILSDLKAQGYIDYKDGTCADCYIIFPPVK
ncbi:MAG: FecR domain-containing protein [Saprospiraceae bacterium]